MHQVITYQIYKNIAGITGFIHNFTLMYPYQIKSREYISSADYYSLSDFLVIH